MSATYTYDNANQVTGISYATGGTTLGTLSYTYDGSGRVASRGGTLFQSKLPGAVTSATYNAANRLTQRVASGVTVSPSWDANGSLTSDGTSTYGWTARNQLKTIGSAASFVYDGLGRRATTTRSGTATSFLYDGWDVAQEQVGGSASANLLLGAGVDERLSRTVGGVTSTYLTDLLGSTVALASGSTPAIVTSYGYDAQGVSNVSGTANTNTFQYAGRENDGTGLVAMRNRYYHPVWGRFVSEDPIELAGGSNLYEYAMAAPTYANDPFGLRASELGSTLPSGTSSLSDFGFQITPPSAPSDLAKHPDPSDKPVQVAETCAEYISENCKASILRVFPGQFLDTEVDDVIGEAKNGDRAARTARNLLFDSRFRKQEIKICLFLK